MQTILRFLWEIPGRQVGVAVAGEQGGLKKEHAGRPHRWAASEPGKDGLADQRLDLKQEKRAEKDSGNENGRNWLAGNSLWCYELRRCVFGCRATLLRTVFGSPRRH